MDQPDFFLHLNATGWTAIGSIAGAVSIIALAVFNIFYLIAARKQANAAQETLRLLQKQLLMSERPFIAVHAQYNEVISAATVYAHNQGVGPALDVEANLVFVSNENVEHSYMVGCLAVNEKFQFLIGDKSNELVSATLRYKSISGQSWVTKVQSIGGHPLSTDVSMADGSYPSKASEWL